VAQNNHWWHSGIDGLGNDVVPLNLGEIEMPRPVKLHNHSQAPNPRRVRIFAAEKGIQLSLEEVDILAGQSRTPEFIAKNSSGGVPVLEFDDGSYLSESVAICRYLEGLHPEPNLLGRDLREQAEIERWNRRMELELFAAIGRTVQNTSPIFQGRFKQFPDYGEAQRTVVYQRLERMDRELNGHQFVAGDRFTIADITALVAIDIGRRLADIKIAPELTHLTRWYQIVSSRPSAKA
jgi:glutathione S-transferase